MPGFMLTHITEQTETRSRQGFLSCLVSLAKKYFISHRPGVGLNVGKHNFAIGQIVAHGQEKQHI